MNVTSGGGSAMTSPFMWGVLLGLLLGKPVGILLAFWAVVKAGLATLPVRATWRHVAGVAVLCGVGFTMSLFVGNLAFPVQTGLLAATKVGILVASVIAGAASGAILASGRRVIGATEPRPD